MRTHLAACAALLGLAAAPAMAASYTIAPLSGANNLGSYFPAVLLDSGVTLGTEGTGGGDIAAFAWGSSYFLADYCGQNGVLDFSSFTAASPDTATRYIGGNCGQSNGRNGFGYVRDTVAGTTTQVQYQGNETFVNGINAGGLVVGTYYSPDFRVLHGYYMIGSTMVPFDPPGSIYTSVFGISTQNTIFGGFSPASGSAYGFLLDEYGRFTYIVPAGAQYTYIVGLNGRNVAAGYYYDSSLTGHAFAWRKGQVLLPPLPGATSSMVAGIDQKGVVAGTYTDAAQVNHGFVWSTATNKVITFDAPPNAFGLNLTSINNTHAEVTGTYLVGSNYVEQAFTASCGGKGCF